MKAASKKQLLGPNFFIEDYWEEMLGFFFWKTKQLLRNSMLLWVKIGEAQNHG